MSTHNENLAQNLGANSNLKPNLNPNSNSSPKALPKTWQIKPLGEIMSVKDGTHESPKYLSEGYPFVTSKNLKNNTISFDNIKYISKQDYDKFNERSKVEIGDVLFAMIGTIGNPVVVTQEVNFAIKNVALFKKSNLILPMFLKYYLETSYVIGKMQSEARGSTQKFVALDYLRNFPIPLPPTMEIQRQIVQRLDTAFEKIDKAVARLKSAKSNLTRYKQSLLKAAFNGTLTKSPHATWQSKTLGEILDYEQPSKYIVKSTKYDDSFQTPVLTAGKSFILGYTDEKDGIFTQIPVIIFDDFTTATKFVDFEFKVKSSAMKILHAKENADIKFVFYYMQTIHHRSDTHKRYWIGEYSKHKILLPPLQTQKEIVQILERHFEGADRTEKFIDSALNRAKMLKQSLLKAAFEGALV